ARLATFTKRRATTTAKISRQSSQATARWLGSSRRSRTQQRRVPIAKERSHRSSRGICPDSTRSSARPTSKSLLAGCENARDLPHLGRKSGRGRRLRYLAPHEQRTQ